MTDPDDRTTQAAETAQRAAMMARAALIIACIAVALSLLGMFLPL